MKAHQFFQAGSMNARLILEESIQTDDGCGGTLENWQPLFDVWARIVPVKGILVSSAGDNHPQYTHWIYLRKRDGISAGMRFLSGSRKFLIEMVCDPDETGRYLHCQVQEIS